MSFQSVVRENAPYENTVQFILSAEEGIETFLSFQKLVRANLRPRHQGLVLEKTEIEIRHLIKQGGRIVYILDQGEIEAAYLFCHHENLYEAEKTLHLHTALPDYLQEQAIYKTVACALVSPHGKNRHIMDKVSASIDWALGMTNAENCLFIIDWKNPETIKSALNQRTSVIGISEDRQGNTVDFVCRRKKTNYDLLAESIYVKMDSNLALIELANSFDLNFVGTKFDFKTRVLELRRLSEIRLEQTA